MYKYLSVLDQVKMKADQPIPAKRVDRVPTDNDNDNDNVDLIKRQN